ncbi:MAG: DUF86 domain-containing protein [Chloroflexota bacterium]
MPQFDKNLVLRKLRDLIKYLGELEPYLSIGVEKYLHDREKRYIVERLIQLIVEVASDVNRSVVEAEDEVPVETYYDTFAKLGELKVIPKELSIRLASTTGLRNRLVHRYEDIDHKIVYHSAVRLLKDYRRYFRLIEKYTQTK